MSAAEDVLAALYGARPVNRRRATHDEMEERAAFFIDYAARHGPVTVRQLYYRAEVQGVAGIEKTEESYRRVQRQVLELRRSGRMPYEHIADATRWMRKPRSYGDPREALRETARFYRKALWRDQNDYAEVWCEKDALAGVIYPVTELYDVPLMVSRGFASETFCFEAVASRGDDPRPYHVLYLGDFDRSGRDAAKALREKLERFAAGRGITVNFVQLAIQDDDIAGYDPATGLARVNLSGVGGRQLPTREPKRASIADRNWEWPFAVELDAVEPDDLRAVVRGNLEVFLPAEEFAVLREAESSERLLLEAWAAARDDDVG
jgi:hypothetical protein